MIPGARLACEANTRAVSRSITTARGMVALDLDLPVDLDLLVDQRDVCKGQFNRASMLRAWSSRLRGSRMAVRSLSTELSAAVNQWLAWDPNSRYLLPLSSRQTSQHYVRQHS